MNLYSASRYRLAMGNPYGAAPPSRAQGVDVTVQTVKKRCPEEIKGDQEEICPEEEMRRFLPYENGGALGRAGVWRSQYRVFV